MNREPGLPLIEGSWPTQARRFRDKRRPGSVAAQNAGIGDATYEAILRLRRAGMAVYRNGHQIKVGGALVTWDQLHWLAQKLPDSFKGEKS